MEHPPALHSAGIRCWGREHHQVGQHPLPATRHHRLRVGSPALGGWPGRSGPGRRWPGLRSWPGLRRWPGPACDRWCACAALLPPGLQSSPAGPLVAAAPAGHCTALHWAECRGGSLIPAREE
jgi:hypothetical protein